MIDSFLSRTTTWLATTDSNFVSNRQPLGDKVTMRNLQDYKWHFIAKQSQSWLCSAWAR